MILKLKYATPNISISIVGVFYKNKIKFQQPLKQRWTIVRDVMKAIFT